MLTLRSTAAILYKLKLNQSVTTIPTGVFEPLLIWPDADTTSSCSGLQCRDSYV